MSTTNVNLLQGRLAEKADPKVKAWWEGYVKDSAPFRGVKMPVIRAVLHGWYEEAIGWVVANSLNSCKRFYHTPAKPEESGYVRVLKNPYLFSALHIYPLPIAVLYGAPDWLYGVFWYGALMVGTLAVLQVPLYLRRPAAMFLTLAALLVNIYFVAPVAGFEWLALALFLKIVLGHHVREEPYRPADLSAQSQNAKAGGPP